MIILHEALTATDFQHLNGLVLVGVNEDEQGNISFKFENDKGVAADMVIDIDGVAHVSDVYSPSFLKEIGELPTLKLEK